ncbi:protein FATTY ACID EXPORT 2, chloroplastic-like [Cucurbita maxima]|uniref:Protein FATTY ACID EXPORT 2, chloroplastic-like n=1 Tax=Cucurbita maxima TaxID=3661 RepID=A0A6J1HYY3_CUCMA|nr:protein FATTY ACID EXPORT 2, chloroplastic-like [Cucurbita maxima]XP_022968194.1 protein FATTY ACID EXPORT 2, chloroplastic-like [Cucurbita maxima]
MAAVLTGLSQASLLFSPRVSGALRINTFSVRRMQFQSSTIRRGSSFDCKTVRSAIRATDSKNEDIDIYPDTTGGDSSDKGIHGDGGGGSGGGKGGRGDNEGNSGEEEESNTNSGKKALSMSQKLTLGYAALVGVGGLMGYLKGGSQKSLLAGGVSATLLLGVCKLLPSNPVLASALGLGLSASLLVVMGSRFKNSGKIFPAGVVSLVSFIMTGGYMHGILRSSH